MRESKIRKECEKYLDSLGASCWYYKTNDGVRQGIPDDVGCYRGWFFAIEYKDDGKGDTTALQEITLNQIGRSGGARCVARSLVDVQRLIRRIDERYLGKTI